MKKEGIELSDETFKNFKASKIIKEHQRDIVGLDFSNDGMLMYSADSTTLNVFQTQEGKLYRKLYMKNHEIELLTHTHHNLAILVATKKGHNILYWSIHDNKVMKCFQGHKDTITNLMMCPLDDSFISSSQDNTVRLWNLNSDSPECLFILNLEEDNVSAYPVASFDPAGVVFAAGWTEQSLEKTHARICLFSKQKCETGPFADWKLDNCSDIKIMKFSKCGDLLLLAFSDNMILLLDAFDGKTKHKLTSFINEASIIECSFTPDSEYIVSGSENGVIHVWTVEGKEVVQLKSHIEKVFYVKFSPVHCMMASGGRNIVWWQPSLEK